MATVGVAEWVQGQAIPSDGGAYYTPGRIPWLKWWVVQQDIANNRSLLHVEVWAYPPNSNTSLSYGPWSGGITDHWYGRIKEGSYTIANNRNEVMLLSHEYWITHYEDGTCWTQISIDGGIPAPVNGWRTTNLIATLTLPTIARTSKISFSPETIEVGETLTLNTNRKATSMTHSFQWTKQAPGTSGRTWNSAFGAGTTDSYNWNIPLDFLKDDPTKASLDIWVACNTYYNGTYIGFSEKKLTIKPAASQKPTFTSFTHAETNSKVSAFALGAGNYVQGKSAVKITGAGGVCNSFGSTAVTYEAALLDSLATAASPIVTSKQAGTKVPITVRAVDSRGMKSDPKVLNVTLLPYSEPKFTEQKTDLFRASGANRNRDDLGSLLVFESQGTLTPLNSKNKLNFYVEYREGTGSYTEKKIINNVAQASWNIKDTLLASANADKPYDCRIFCWDSLMDKPATPLTDSVAVAIPVLHIGQKGIAVNKFVDDTLNLGLDVIGDSKIVGNLQVTGKLRDNNALDVPWTTLSLASGVTQAYGQPSPQACVKNGVVFLKGGIQKSGSFENNSDTLIGTLPTAIPAPLYAMYFPVAFGTYGSTPVFGAVGNAWLGMDRKIYIENKWGSFVSYVMLNGISFPV